MCYQKCSEVERGILNCVGQHRVNAPYSRLLQDENFNPFCKAFHFETDLLFILFDTFQFLQNVSLNPFLLAY